MDLLQRATRVAFVVLALLLAPGILWAQSGITGVAKDTSGAVLPGVTVEAASPVLIEKVRSAVTDAAGVYRIVDLRPGTYTVTFTLPGFSTFKRDGVELPSEFTATVNADMAVGALEETITVSGEAPVVDIRSSRAQTQFAEETLQSIPGTGRLATLPAIMPGVTLRRESDRGVGGLSDRTQTAYSVHGAPEAQPVVDGMNHQITGLTSGVYVYNQIGIQEVVVETSGVGADRDTGGMQLNMISKDGGNVFSGTANFSYVGPDLEWSNLNDELLARNLDPQRIGSVKKFRDSAAAVGGPIKRDKLWVFGAFREGVTQQYAEGIYDNLLLQPGMGGNSFLYEQDRSKPTNSNDYSKDVTVRFTWQAAAKHKIVLASSFQPNCNCVFNLLNPGTRRTREAAGPHHYSPNYVPSYSWTYPATNRILIEAGGSANVINQHDTREPGFPRENIQIMDQGLNLIYGNVAERTLPRRQYQERVAVSYVTGSHNFKMGFSHRYVRIGDIDKLGSDIWMNNTGVEYRLSTAHLPNRLTLRDAPWNFEESVRDLALYVQDQWTIQRLTVNAGVRYNDAKGSTPVQVLSAGFWVPERRFEPTDNNPHFSNISPRLGVAYDILGTGRTALKASIGHYPDRVVSAQANPANNMTRSTNVNWTDTDRDFFPDCNLLNPAGQSLGDVCGAWASPNFGKESLETTYAKDATEGFNNQFDNWQTSVSVQHELRPGLGVNVGYFRTWYGGFLATDSTAWVPSDYAPFCVQGPVDDRLPGSVSGQQVCGLFDLDPAKFNQRNFVVDLLDNTVDARTNQPVKQTQVYNGVDMTMNWRFGTGGLVSGGGSIGRTVTDNCFTIDSPQQERDGFCHVAPTWGQASQVKFMVVYPLFYEISASAIYQNSSGIPVTSTYTVSNAEARQSATNPGGLTRNLGACLAATGNCNATVDVELIAPNTMFEPRLQQVDLRFSKVFALGGARRFRAGIDIYNLLNASNVLNMNFAYGQGWQDVTQILGGRLIKLGAQFDF